MFSALKNPLVSGQSTRTNMSDLADTAVADAPVVEAGDSASPPVESGTFDDANFDSIFGLEPETVPEPDPDVPTVADPPVNHQDAEIKTDAETVPETVTDEAQTEKPLPGLSEKLDWATAPEQFREGMATLKAAYLELENSDLEHTFVTDPQGFAKRLLETSPDSYVEVGKLLASEGAKENPQGWIKYFVDTHPDMVAAGIGLDYFVEHNADEIVQALTGREGLTAERLKAELAVAFDDDDPDVQAQLAKLKGEPVKEAAKPEIAETPEQIQMREFLEEREAQAGAAATNSVFEPIIKSINNLVSQAGLEIDDSEYDKPFDSLSPEIQTKVMANKLLPMWIDMRASQDPKTVALQARAQYLLATKDAEGKSKKPDVEGAKRLQHHMEIVATNHTAEFLSIFTGVQAKAKQAETKSPTTDEPKPIVKSAGNGAAPFLANDSDNPWAVTEKDFISIGR